MPAIIYKSGAMAAKSAIVPVSNLKNALWVYIFIFWGALLVFQFYSPSANTFVHASYSSGIESQRFSFDFVVSAAFVLLWTVPITLAFALDRPKSSWRQWFHLVIAVLLFLWFMATAIYGIINMAHANDDDIGNFYNPANDDRWCCLYASKDGAPCYPNVSCNGFQQQDLKVNGIYVFQFCFNVVFFFVLLADILVTLVVMIPSFSDPGAYNIELTESLMEVEMKPMGSSLKSRPLYRPK